MRISLFILFFHLTFTLCAQEFYTRTAHVHVKSDNRIKSIEADNYQVIAFLSLESGDIRFEGLLRSFEFRLGALDRVYNSRNIDISEYPSILFEGKAINIDEFDLNSSKTQTLRVKGNLFIWDEKRVTEVDVNVIVRPGNILDVVSAFNMRIEEQSVDKLNQLMRDRLPKSININTSKLGVSRDIEVDVKMKMGLKNW
ncbi:MAG: hypothetical protein HKN09_11820 [Saprospiraceae bacterium]|nr:hypothetical protein [Saprospiraceae bacterium]